MTSISIHSNDSLESEMLFRVEKKSGVCFMKRVIVQATDTIAQTYHLVILCKIEHKLTSAHPDKIENIMYYLMDSCEFT